MKSLKGINLYTQIHQFCENQLQKDSLYFHEKVLKKC